MAIKGYYKTSTGVSPIVYARATAGTSERAAQEQRDVAVQKLVQQYGQAMGELKSVTTEGLTTKYVFEKGVITEQRITIPTGEPNTFQTITEYTRIPSTAEISPVSKIESVQQEVKLSPTQIRERIIRATAKGDIITEQIYRSPKDTTYNLGMIRQELGKTALKKVDENVYTYHAVSGHETAPISAQFERLPIVRDILFSLESKPAYESPFSYLPTVPPIPIPHPEIIKGEVKGIFTFPRFVETFPQQVAETGRRIFEHGAYTSAVFLPSLISKPKETFGGIIGGAGIVAGGIIPTFAKVGEETSIFFQPTTFPEITKKKGEMYGAFGETSTHILLTYGIGKGLSKLTKPIAEKIFPAKTERGITGGVYEEKVIIQKKETPFTILKGESKQFYVKTTFPTGKKIITGVSGEDILTVGIKPKKVYTEVLGIFPKEIEFEAGSIAKGEISTRIVQKGLLGGLKTTKWIETPFEKIGAIAKINKNLFYEQAVIKISGTKQAAYSFAQKVMEKPEYFTVRLTQGQYVPVYHTVETWKSATIGKTLTYSTATVHRLPKIPYEKGFTEFLKKPPLERLSIMGFTKTAKISSFMKNIKAIEGITIPSVTEKIAITEHAKIVSQEQPLLRFPPLISLPTKQKPIETVELKRIAFPITAVYPITKEKIISKTAITTKQLERQKRAITPSLKSFLIPATKQEESQRLITRQVTIPAQITEQRTTLQTRPMIATAFKPPLFPISIKPPPPIPPYIPPSLSINIRKGRESFFRVPQRPTKYTPSILGIMSKKTIIKMPKVSTGIDVRFPIKRRKKKSIFDFKL